MHQYNSSEEYYREEEDRQIITVELMEVYESVDVIEKVLREEK